MIGFFWVDIICFSVVLFTLWKSIHFGLVAELLKIIGILASIFIALHYYIKLGSIISVKADLPLHSSQFLSFIVLTVSVVGVFYAIKGAWLIIFKIENVSLPDKVFGFFISLIRAYLVCGLILFGIYLSGWKSMMTSANRSMVRKFIDITPLTIYQLCYDGFISKVFVKENFNKAVLDVIPVEKAAGESPKSKDIKEN